MESFRNEKLLRLKDIVPGLIPISKSQWWAGIKSGMYPPGIKLGKSITAWRYSDIKYLMENGIEQGKAGSKEESGRKRLSPAVGAAGDANARLIDKF